MQFLFHYLQTWQEVQIENRLGLGIYKQSEHAAALGKLQELHEAFRQAFLGAFDLVKTAKDPFALSTVLVHFGIAAGLRGSTYRHLNINDGAEAEKRVCKTSLLQAKDIYNEMGNEFHAANAIFNLANQIRFFGEVEEAKELVKWAIEIARKFDNKLLAKKAGWLLQTLESGRIPDHIHGERYQ